MLQTYPKGETTLLLDIAPNMCGYANAQGMPTMGVFVPEATGALPRLHDTLLARWNAPRQIRVFAKHRYLRAST